MAKDAKGHGSNSHDYSGVKTYPAITGFEGLRKSLNLDALQAGGQPVSGNANAAHELSSGGPKSVASPVQQTQRDGRPAVEWTWEGNDEENGASGRGWARTTKRSRISKRVG